MLTQCEFCTNHCASQAIQKLSTCPKVNTFSYHFCFVRYRYTWRKHLCTLMVPADRAHIKHGTYTMSLNKGSLHWDEACISVSKRALVHEQGRASWEPRLRPRGRPHFVRTKISASVRLCSSRHFGNVVHPFTASPTGGGSERTDRVCDLRVPQEVQTIDAFTPQSENESGEVLNSVPRSALQRNERWIFVGFPCHRSRSYQVCSFRARLGEKCGSNHLGSARVSLSPVRSKEYFV